MQYLILCRSVTYAQKAVRLLQSSGIFASVTKAPQSANPGGCTYGAKVGARNLDRAVELLRGAGLYRSKVFSVSPRGEFEEVQP